MMQVVQRTSINPLRGTAATPSFRAPRYTLLLVFSVIHLRVQSILSFSTITHADVTLYNNGIRDV